jgi:hypothetical protein
MQLLKRPRRSADLPAEFAELDSRGYMVIPDVVPKADCKASLKGIEDWLAAIGSPVNFRDPASWDDQSKVPYTIHGILQQYQSAHCPAVVNMRQHPAVYEVFCRLWECRELLTSLDGFYIKPSHAWLGKRAPYDHHPKSERALAGIQGEWYHYDQGPGKLYDVSIQGFVTLYDMDEGDSTLGVLENSHKHHREFFRQFPARCRTNDDWVKFTDEEVLWLYNHEDVKEVRIPAKRGSLVLWRSNTAHCVLRPLPENKEPHHRCVIYTCYAPAHRATAKDINAKRKAYHDFRVVNHYPSGGKPFGKGVRYPGYLRPEDCTFPKDHAPLTELGKRLFGLVDWARPMPAPVESGTKF